MSQKTSRNPQCEAAYCQLRIYQFDAEISGSRRQSWNGLYLPHSIQRAESLLYNGDAQYISNLKEAKDKIDEAIDATDRFALGENIDSMIISIDSKNRSLNLSIKQLEIKDEKSSINFWSTSGMMAPFYELLRVMSDWLVKRGVKKDNAQKYIASLFLALSEDAVVNSKKDLKYLVKESQTPKGLNEQGVKELTKFGFYKSLEKTLNGIHKRLNR